MELRPMTICSDCLVTTARRIRFVHLRARSLTLLQQHRQQLATSSSIDTPRQRDVRHQNRLQSYRTRDLSTAVNAPGKADLGALHNRILELTETVLKPREGPVPPEQRVLYVLEQIDALARSIADANSIAGAVSLNGSATSALLGSVNSRRTKPTVSKALLLSTVSKRAEDIVRNANVFITPAILKAYVQLQKLLHQPASFPDIFELYASKPAPHAAANGEVTYSRSQSRSVKAAIDRDTADAALASAITAHDLQLALRIIDSSLAAPAFARAKAIRQCALPAAGVALLPAVVYGLSTQFASWQSMMSQSQATGIAFAGIMTYVSVVGSMGYVALTTSNDQMDRVTWAHGVPLWERWAREEERAAFDNLASAWGFKSVEKRGDEEGEDWEILRETCGLRGMELDRVELMEGMQ